MTATGYIQIHAYTSNAQIPLQDVSITITDLDGSAIAMRLTNRSGILDQPIAIPVPPRSSGQSPDTGVIPFTSVNLYGKIKDYEEIYIKNVQVFPDTVTLQNLEFIPISELLGNWTKSETFQIPAQNL